MDAKTRKLRAQTKAMSPDMIIGKRGINDEVIKNIKRHLKAYGAIKIKILPTYIEGKDKKRIAQELADKCGARLVSLVGFTVVLAA